MRVVDGSMRMGSSREIRHERVGDPSLNPIVPVVNAGECLTAPGFHPGTQCPGLGVDGFDRMQNPIQPMVGPWRTGDPNAGHCGCDLWPRVRITSRIRGRSPTATCVVVQQVELHEAQQLLGDQTAQVITSGCRTDFDSADDADPSPPEVA